MSYYLLAGTVITGIGYLYVYESNRIIELGVNISWEVMKMVSTVSGYLGIDTNEENYNFMNDEEYLEGNEEENEMLLKKNTFIKKYNIEKNESYNISMEDIGEKKEDMDVIFLKTIKEDEVFYFRLDNLDNLEEIE